MTELNVLFDGKSVLPDEKQESDAMETFMFVHIDRTTILAGASLELIDIKIDKPGTYDIILKIFEDLDGNPGDLLDEKTSSLIATIPMRV